MFPSRDTLKNVLQKSKYKTLPLRKTDYLVDTQRRFNVYKTSKQRCQYLWMSYRRWNDVK